MSTQHALGPKFAPRLELLLHVNLSLASFLVISQLCPLTNKETSYIIYFKKNKSKNKIPRFDSLHVIPVCFYTMDYPKKAKYKHK